jgi:hypothetical protein
MKSKMAAGMEEAPELFCNGSNCFPPKVSAFSPAAFSDPFPV